MEVNSGWWGKWTQLLMTWTPASSTSTTASSFIFCPASLTFFFPNDLLDTSTCRTNHWRFPWNRPDQTWYKSSRFVLCCYWMSPRSRLNKALKSFQTAFRGTYRPDTQKTSGCELLFIFNAIHTPFIHVRRRPNMDPKDASWEGLDNPALCCWEL